MNYSIGIENIVDFSPQDEITEILQNVRTIMATTKGSVPLDRDFGVSANYVDKPMAKAKAMLAAEIIQAVRKYEPRVTITGISFTESMDGKLEPRIEVRLNGIKESS